MAKRTRFTLFALSRRCRSDERGSAIVEFIFASTILLIPMIYLVLAAAALEAGSYAVVSAADQAAKVFALAQNPAQAHSNAQAVAERAMANFGFSGAHTSISCDAQCLSPGSVVTVTVSLDVPLPVVSDYLRASAFTVDSTAAQRVDRFG
ncbi:hypothetical protein [Glutamicibacter sp. NPDC087344]|uniref:hypothetical protein n=1 Tax=Glutamicibacter sp. NPDC087344 TaxID=3363994 RepID=UPI0038200AF0